MLVASCWIINFIWGMHLDSHGAFIGYALTFNLSWWGQPARIGSNEHFHSLALQLAIGLCLHYGPRMLILRQKKIICRAVKGSFNPLLGPSQQLRRALNMLNSTLSFHLLRPSTCLKQWIATKKFIHPLENYILTSSSRNKENTENKLHKTRQHAGTKHSTIK